MSDKYESRELGIRTGNFTNKHLEGNRCSDHFGTYVEIMEQIHIIVSGMTNELTLTLWPWNWTFK